MGNEASLTRDCKLEREVRTPTPKSWRLYQSKHRDGAKVSVFVYEPDQENVQYIQNAAKYLKVLRHPSILKFDGLEDTSDGIWLATEQVTPLENVLEDLSAAEIVAGIYSVLEGLVFLHERGGMSHNNICLSSLFVSEDGSWKLGGVEFLCRFSQVSQVYLTKCREFRDERALAPEEKAGQLSDTDPGYARDVYAFGVLMDSLLEYLADLGDLTKTFELRVQDECLNPEPGRRPKLSSFLNDRLFRNDYLQIVNFLKNITLKSEVEKKTFFSDLAEKLYDLPLDLLASRLAKPLLSRFVLLDETACEALIPHLLTPYTDQRPPFRRDTISPLIPDKMFRKHVVPELFRIFHVRDAHIRTVLLAHFDCYMGMFDTEMLNSTILPQILLGLRDTNDELVRLSLHAIAYLVPVLGGDVVVGARRMRLFAEATPKFSEKNGPASLPLKSDKLHPTTSENNGIANKSLKSGPDPPSPSSSTKQRTLQDLAREAERDKRRQEAKRRSEERRKRRQEKQPQRARLVSDGDTTEEISEDQTHPSDWSGPGKESTNQETDHDDDHDFDQEIENELETMDSTIPKQSHVQFQSPHHSQDRIPKGKPLKLTSSKMRTSPPPGKKKDILSNDVSPAKEDQWTADDGEKWAEGGDDDNWNSTGWDDMEQQNASPAESPSTKHSRTSSDSNQQGAVPGGMSLKGKSQNKAVPTKPRVVDVDISSLDIKTSVAAAPVKDEIDDLFADMQPVIKRENDSLWGVLNGETASAKVKPEVKKAESPKKSAPMNFAVVDVAETEDGDGGWGADDDWDGEDL